MLFSNLAQLSTSSVTRSALFENVCFKQINYYGEHLILPGHVRTLVIG